VIRKATSRGALLATQRTLKVKLEVIAVAKEGPWTTAFASEVTSAKVPS
jgi:hypothetical protein